MQENCQDVSGPGSALALLDARPAQRAGPLRGPPRVNGSTDALVVARAEVLRAAAWEDAVWFAVAAAALALVLMSL